MPIPKREPKEDRNKFMSRCMSDPTMKEEYKKGNQRVAICLQNATEGMTLIEKADFENNIKEYGYAEEIDENNLYIPTEAEYIDFGEEEAEWDIAADRPGLWENIRKKKEREGKNYKPAQPGDPDRPTKEQIKRAQSDEGNMAKGQLAKIAKQATELSQKVQNGSELDAWIQDKISKAEHFVEAVYDYVMYSEAEEAEAVQYGKPPKNDPRKTPAPPKDRKKGSKKNKPGSAKNPKGKITFSKNTIDKLKKKVQDHNKKGKGSKATLGMLKAVYRRGAGAYSTSHAPKMSRDGWAMARVNAFLYLLRNGRPSNPNYKQDNDLLPKGHKRSSKAEESVAEKFEYKDPKTGEIFTYNRRGIYKKDGRTLVPTDAAEYQGRKVKLNKPFRTPDGPKKFSVYVKNEKGNVVKVNFGDPNMEIKRDNPARRKSFRARHNCDNPGPKWKPRYWSCRAW